MSYWNFNNCPTSSIEKTVHLTESFRIHGRMACLFWLCSFHYQFLIWSYGIGSAICFSTVLWRSVFCVGFSLSCFSLLLFVLPSYFVTCCLVYLLICLFVYVLNVCKFVFGVPIMIFVFVFVCLVFSWVCRGEVRFLGEFGVLVHLRLRWTVVFDGVDGMSGGHCTHPLGGASHKKHE